MKKQFLLIPVIACFMYAMGQEDELIISGTTKINRQLTPQPVIDSFYKTFPQAIALEYYQVSSYAARSAWTVDEADSLVSLGDENCYLLIIKRDGLKFYSLFSAGGELVMTKLKEEDVTALPSPVQASLRTIHKDYPGYRIRSQAFYKNQDHARHLYYEVIAERGNQLQRFFYARNGTLVKSEGIVKESKW